MKNKSAVGLFFAGLPYIFLFSGMFVWFALVSDYILYFQEKSMLFLFSGEYLSDNLSKPGGALYCLSALLTSFYHLPAAGALIISGTITMVTLFVSQCVFGISGRNEKIYPFVTGLLLFVMHTDYSVFLQNSLGILLNVMALALLIKMSKNGKDRVILLLFPLSYFITGGFCWVFLIAASLYFLVIGRKHLLISIASPWFVIFLTWMFSRNFIFFSSDADLLLYPVNFPENKFSEIIFFTASGLLFVLPVIAIIRFPVLNLLSGTYRSEIMIRTIFLSVTLLVICIFRYNGRNIHYFHSEKLFSEGKYDELTEYNARNPSKNILTLFLNNIALEEKGLLNDRLFDFMQSADGKTLFLKWEMITEILKRGGHFYYATGMINEAHRWAYENMVMKGYTPEDLKMLIKTELINGNYTMASKYIALLKKSLFYKKDAAGFEKFLYSDEAVAADSQLGEKRKIRLRTDFFSITDDPFVNIQRVNMTDTLNRKAFDYMIAYLLLKKDYKNLSASLSRFDALGYPSFPRHVEEALLVITTMNNGENPYHGNLKVSRSTEERWTQFLTVFQQYGNNPGTAEPALRKQFGNTFWYWAFYR